MVFRLLGEALMRGIRGGLGKQLAVTQLQNVEDVGGIKNGPALEKAVEDEMRRGRELANDINQPENIENGKLKKAAVNLRKKDGVPAKILSQQGAESMISTGDMTREESKHFSQLSTVEAKREYLVLLDRRKKNKSR